MLNHDRPEDLTKGIGLLYSIFHIDLENLALLLFHHTLPAILQADDSKLSLLTDPRGRYLAKLCIMSLVAVHKMKQSDRSTYGVATSQFNFSLFVFIFFENFCRHLYCPSLIFKNVLLVLKFH